MNKTAAHSTKAYKDLFVVAIGASAGGLEALEKFFSTCPADTGMAFVVVQHLSPDHKSMMSDLLARYTKMPIKVVEHGMLLEANCVYLIPAGNLMRMEGNKFLLTKKSPHVFTLPIDIFFSSLAQYFQAHTIGVILSGTGSDGTRGAYAINEAGGLLLAQDPQTAKFDGMPNSIIGTGLVDEILPAEAIAERIVYHTQNPQPKHANLASVIYDRPIDEESSLELIFQLLIQLSGIDFREYKPATVGRRIERRMQLKHIATLQDYALCLEQDKTELMNLRRELLIPVTSFFRDAAAFENLTQLAINELVSNTKSNESIRVWVAGTSTGEEAYSIAMLFMEAFERHKKWPNLKIFATDVNPLIIEYAAAGQYPESIAAELTEERLNRFFNLAGSMYTVKPELRQCIIFARHNLLTDPPFTRMDLVSCRNTLIYFKTEAQLGAMQRLQYALKTDGILFLGSSESISAVANNFTVMSAKHKIFKRNNNKLPIILEVNNSPNAAYSSNRRSKSHVGVVNRALNDVSLIEVATNTLLNAYTPPSILVNDRYEAIHLYGNLQPFFQVRQGAVTMMLNRILPDKLIPVVSALVFKCLKDKTTIYSDVFDMTMQDQTQQLLRVCVRFMSSEGDEKFVLLSFELQHNAGHHDQYQTVDVSTETAARIEVLQQELNATRESLQATIEELETSNEELQATNEELMASNEELQSSNEELQSVNEEINTVNAEYQEKVITLNQVNADLDTMAKAVGVATIFVDHHLQITRFTTEAKSIFKLRDYDLGRPLSDISHLLKDNGHIDLILKTIESGTEFEQQVLSTNGKTYLLKILPYHVSSNDHNGAVVTSVSLSSRH